MRQASIPIKEEWPLNELFLHENKRTTVLSDNNNNNNNNGNTSINFHGDDENTDILAKLNHYSSQPQFTNHTSSSSSNNFNSSGTINNSSGLLRNELVSATGSSSRTFVPANGFSKEINTD